MTMTNKQKRKTIRAGALETAANRPGWSLSASRETQRAIAGRLRTMHDDLFAEGVPERFRELLARLDPVR